MALGDNCRAGCRTRDHESWGECARDANLRVGWAPSISGLTKADDRKHESELNAYKAARDQGIQPESTRIESVRKAVEISETMGKAYNSEVMPPSNLLTSDRVIKQAQEVGQL